MSLYNVNALLALLLALSTYSNISASAVYALFTRLTLFSENSLLVARKKRRAREIDTPNGDRNLSLFMVFGDYA